MTLARPLLVPRRVHLRLADYLFLLPAFIYVCATMLIRVHSNLRMSLFNVDVMTFLGGQAPFVGIGNYQKLFGDPTFLYSLWLSLVFTGGSLLFQFTIGFALALSLFVPFRQWRHARAVALRLAAADCRQRQPLSLDA